jgi:two-component system, chemotaxis family, protein-glutamate methylesterase/glutaminase
MKRVVPIKVLLVDDSPMVRTVLAHSLSGYADIEVVGGAKDAFEARELIIQHHPDVIILDIEMPRMDGVTFLRKLMAHYPVPVIMCSGTTPTTSATALEAIAAGAVDVVAKPVGGSQALKRLGDELAEKIVAAAASRPRTPPIPVGAAAIPASFRAAGLNPDRYLVAIGASTGGTEAIREVLMAAPEDFPPVVMVQHMPAGFTQSFAARLDKSSPLAVTEAVGGEVLASGMALLARGGIQLRVRRRGDRWQAVYGDSTPVNRHCPSVDVLFDSVAEVGERHTVGVLLTGMGADGARGLLRMRGSGALTIAQDQASCVVYGMPKVAVELGAAEQQCSPPDVPGMILRQLIAREALRAATIRERGHRIQSA